MAIFGLIILVAATAFIFLKLKSNVVADATQSELEILEVRFEPESGSALMAGKTLFETHVDVDYMFV